MVVYIFCAICSLHLNCGIHWHKIVHNTFFYIRMIYSDILSFISNIGNICLLSLFLDHSGLRFINFINFFPKNQLFVSFIFFLLFVFYFNDYCYLYNFLLSAYFGFTLFFFSSFRWKLMSSRSFLI